MSAYRQRYIALEVLYLGWRYHGFASQAGTDLTVEASHPLLHSSLSLPTFTSYLATVYRRDDRGHVKRDWQALQLL